MIYDINVPVIISKFKSHDLVKDRILNIIKNLNYPAFIRSTSLGTEVCVVDEQQN